MASTEKYRKQTGQVKVRLSDEQLARLDRLAKGNRADYAKRALLKAIGWNEAPKRPNPPNQKAKR